MLSWTSEVRVSSTLAAHQCEGLLAHLEQDVDGFAGAAVVDLSTGATVATHCVQPSFNMTAVLKAAKQTVSAHMEAEASGGTLLEIAVTDARRFHLYQLLSPSMLLVVSAQRSHTNMAMLRAVVRRRYLPMVDQVIAARLAQELG